MCKLCDRVPTHTTPFNKVSFGPRELIPIGIINLNFPYKLSSVLILCTIYTCILVKSIFYINVCVLLPFKGSVSLIKCKPLPGDVKRMRNMFFRLRVFRKITLEIFRYRFLLAFLFIPPGLTAPV